MHVRLTNPYTPPAALELAKIAAVKVEENREDWIDLWIVYGTEEGGAFREYQDPVTGQVIAAVLVHLEDGHHPLAPRGTALSRCDTCEAWGAFPGPCEVDGCSGTREPYDGLTRLLALEADRPRAVLSFWRALYRFLMAEEVPDPSTGELRKLLDAEIP